MILYDESYFPLTYITIKDNGGYCTSDVSKLQTFLIFAIKTRFEVKKFVWIAMGPKDLECPFIQKSDFSVNG